MGKIVDISHHQGNINWPKFAKAVGLVIIRTQDGSRVEDTMHVYNEAQAIKNGVPFGVYAFNRSLSTADARIEAKDFYKRANKNAKFYVIDVETVSSAKSNGGSGESMRSVIKAYVAQLRQLTKKKIGLYVANHLYDQLKLDISDFDFVWIPRYGPNAPTHKCDIWQYTETGKVDGVAGTVDLNKLIGKKKLKWYVGEKTKPKKRPVKTPVVPKKKATKTKVAKPSTYTIKSGDTLSKIATKHGTSVSALMKLNKIKNKDLIYAGEKLKLK